MMESKEFQMGIAGIALLCAGMAIGYMYSENERLHAEAELLRMKLELEKQKNETKSENMKDEAETEDPAFLPKK